jgi:aspartate aminotransferase-like enzyme
VNHPPPTVTNLLDLMPVGAADIRAVEDAVGRLLRTRSDVVLMQAEAIVLLEATARSLAGPGMRALNVVTGPYGALFGHWLAGAGAEVHTLAAPYDRAVSADEVADHLSREEFDLVSVVHAEAATGSANPIAEIAEITQAAGALLVVDAVASVGAQPVLPDDWNADVVVIGGQKALAGPAGVSAASISEPAWSRMDQNLGAPRNSVLSLLDLRDGWLRPGRAAVLGTPSSLETAALGQALARVESEGLDAVVARHRAAAAATRAGLRLLGLAPWIANDGQAATVVTTVAAPAAGSDALIAAARAAGSKLLGYAPGAMAATTLRINHTGRSADLTMVCDELVSVAEALGRPSGPAVAGAESGWLESLSG